ncbi:malto-oligosyltrehalose synthase [Afifella aestuarii]|uniref:malto-oligosyltrehalose synthase n=1 Tax=Afifella aestuarii TaxID=1909496 RepID=UPI0013E349FE|nr:malto-oligosyltrehalose synthase [Afifella aestuarii]
MREAGPPLEAVPTATYRLQFREGMDFDTAAGLAPYLKRLGISHLYASPIFTAVPGSTHGYDVADFAELDPALGGAEGFARLADALKANGLKLLLDIVPNHMGASTANPYWADVLEWGEESQYAGYFDIDWSAAKLLIPALGAPYGKVLEDGEFGLRFDKDEGRFRFTYYDIALPLAPNTYGRILGEIDEPDFQELSLTFATGSADGAGLLQERLATLAEDPEALAKIERAVGEIAADREALHDLHEAQNWRLAHWRMARETLTYRRFFEITDLVGVQVDRPSVFEATHALVKELAERGDVAGLRIDHIDGLADPKAYLAQLAEIENAPYVVVEKILGPDERLPETWRTAGTTGYEFAHALTALQVDTEGLSRLDEAWREETGETRPFSEIVRETKRRILTYNLAGELAYLVERAREIGKQDPTTRDYGPDSLRRALIEIATAFPVYRSYVDLSGASQQDRELVVAAGEEAKLSPFVEDPGVVDFLVGLLLLENLSDHETIASALYLARRFQQTTGPMMAKALEDTVFYRFNRLIALNEVGGEPEPGPQASFHPAMQERLETQPQALSTTATHDTKRGEDARARISTISEMAEEWADAVKRWNAILLPLVAEIDDGPAPEPNVVWLFHQALLGGWPLELQPDDHDGMRDLVERLEAFMLKAVREAKERTSWTAANTAYEEKLSNFVRSALSNDFAAYRQDFLKVSAPLFAAGAVNSLVQTVIKLTAPGVPDVYQGTELWDLSFVDPDNRRPVDFDRRRALLDEFGLDEFGEMSFSDALSRWREAVPKAWLVQRLLRLRGEHRGLFLEGSYEPLAVEGPMAAQITAYARRVEGETLVVIVPRLPLSLLERDDGLTLRADAFADTFVSLPGGAARFADLLGGGDVEGDRIAASELFRRAPLALLFGSVS